MYEEQELERQQFLAGWDRQSCAEFEAFLDEWHGSPEDDEADRQDYIAGQASEEPPCECLQIDVDLFDNRNCPLHGGF